MYFLRTSWKCCEYLIYIYPVSVSFFNSNVREGADSNFKYYILEIFKMNSILIHMYSQEDGLSVPLK